MLIKINKSIIDIFIKIFYFIITNDINTGKYAEGYEF